jgi:hypothetical protein
MPKALEGDGPCLGVQLTEYLHVELRKLRYGIFQIVVLGQRLLGELHLRPSHPVWRI